MKRNSIRNFWEKRAEISDYKNIESLVNFETNNDLAELKIKEEIACVSKHFPLDENDILIDLGAGIGQWSFRFAPYVKCVYAVEYIEKFIDIAKKTANDQKLFNIEFIQCVAEDYILLSIASKVFISGLLHYLDDERYTKLLNNLINYTDNSSLVFLREPISVLENEYEIDGKYSESLESEYSTIYRTLKQHTTMFQNAGYELQESAPFFRDNSPLNKHKETRLFYLIFKKGIRKNEQQ